MDLLRACDIRGGLTSRLRECARATACRHAQTRSQDAALHRSSGRGSAPRGDRDLTPDLADADRELLITTLRSRRQAIVDRGAAEQLLHGEPHPGNVLSTKSGPLFIDFETCCRGPVEFDLAHVPEDVSERYADADQDLLATAEPLSLRWSPRGDGIRATSSRIGNEQVERSSALCDWARRGRRSTS